MARTIEEIKKGMTTEWMANMDVVRKYGLDKPGREFSEVFSRVSIENMLFYITASAIWLLEKIFDNYKVEVENKIANEFPHTPRWYRNMALKYMKDKILPEGSAEYDTKGMTEEEIKELQVIKYAAAVENASQNGIILKIAGENDGKRGPIDEVTLDGFKAYIAEVKDAGVRVDVVNKDGDQFSCDITVYYNAMRDGATVKSNIEQAIKTYLTNLPFNGRFTITELSDAVKAVESVEFVGSINAQIKTDNDSDYQNIDAYAIPSSGYYQEPNINIEMKTP